MPAMAPELRVGPGKDREMEEDKGAGARAGPKFPNQPATGISGPRKLGPQTLKSFSIYHVTGMPGILPDGNNPRVSKPRLILGKSETNAPGLILGKSETNAQISNNYRLHQGEK